MTRTHHGGGTTSQPVGDIRIRKRLDADLEQLDSVARRVHASDRYPIFLPDGDVRRFLTQPDSVAAWVATIDDQVIGHVALNDATSLPVMDIASTLDDERPALYVARLLVDPDERRSGAGQALLHHAHSEAIERGVLPVLDVVDIPTAAPAIALYRAAGWREVARVSFDLVDMHLDEIVFIGPGA